MEKVFEFFSFAGYELDLFIVSMIPIIELRGGIIMGAALGLSWYKVFAICVLGNLLPIPFVILFSKKILRLLKNIKIFSNLAVRYENSLIKKSEKVKKYSFWGLCLFVAIPLPGTGAWSGAALAALMDMPVKKAFLFITIGVVIAGTIMTMGSYGIATAF